MGRSFAINDQRFKRHRPELRERLMREGEEEVEEEGVEEVHVEEEVNEDSRGLVPEERPLKFY